jgi:lipopolysaccharide transport system permease protein
LIFSLTKKELKVKYRGSFLGFFWSLINPLLTMLVYTFVFSFVMRLGVKDYAVFLISALLSWNFLANSVSYGANCIVANSNLVNKIYFPREIIPFSVVFANLFNFLLEMTSLMIVLTILGYKFYMFLYWLPVLIIAEFFLVAGLTLLVSAVNVFFRDLSHLINIIIMVWFFGTPIIYPLNMVPPRFQVILRFNPMTTITSMYRNMFYHVKYPDGLLWPNWFMIVTNVGVILFIFFLGYFLFKRLEPRFAEEI